MNNHIRQEKKLKRELFAAKRDTERLDWAEKNAQLISFDADIPEEHRWSVYTDIDRMAVGMESTIRKAIDKARKKQA